jgi:hypothetical protein
VAKRITKGNLWGFIQSRPYTAIADIRRLFGMSVDVAACLATTDGTYFVGLPPDVASLVGQLWHEGRIVLDTNPDVKARVVQGIYPARAAFGRGLAAAPGPPAANRPAPAGDDDSAIAPPGAGEVHPGKRRRRRRRRAAAAADDGALGTSTLGALTG